MFGWYYEHLRKKLIYWEKRVIEAEGRWNYYIEQWRVECIKNKDLENRNAKLLRKLNYYRRKQYRMRNDSNVGSRSDD